MKNKNRSSSPQKNSTLNRGENQFFSLFCNQNCSIITFQPLKETLLCIIFLGKHVLQKFNINDDIKFVSTPLAPYFKLKATMSPIIVEEREHMTHMPYASAVDSLMYAMMCTRPDLSQDVSMVSRYMDDPRRDHWEAVK